MCPICKRRMCLPGCPNYRALYTKKCRICGCGICHGENYYRLCGDVTVCAACAEELSVYGFAVKCDEAGVRSVADALDLTEVVA